VPVHAAPTNANVTSSVMRNLEMDIRTAFFGVV